MGLFNIPKLSFNNSAPRVVNGSYEPEFKAFYTGMANLKLRNVYIRNTADNVSQLDVYLNQKATTFKKLETGDANQWVQYSFTMSDEEFNELVNRNNNLRINPNTDVQLPSFAQEDIQLRAIYQSLAVGAWATVTTSIINSGFTATNRVYIVNAHVSTFDAANVFSFRLLKDTTPIFSAYTLQNANYEMRNYEIPAGSALRVQLQSYGIANPSIDVYVAYYAVNRVI